MIAHTLSLDYSLQPGWMAPFVEGLQKGEVLARQCEACGRKSFPPHRICTCGEPNGVWVPLPGTARVEFRTTGSDGDFALVQFDGADCRSVVRLEGIAADQTCGRIRAAQGPLPEMILGPVEGSSA